MDNRPLSEQRREACARRRSRCALPTPFRQAAAEHREAIAGELLWAAALPEAAVIAGTRFQDPRWLD
jgi:hypothetical protein